MLALPQVQESISEQVEFKSFDHSFLHALAENELVAFRRAQEYDINTPTVRECSLRLIYILF